MSQARVKQEHVRCLQILAVVIALCVFGGTAWAAEPAENSPPTSQAHSGSDSVLVGVEAGGMTLLDGGDGAPFGPRVAATATLRDVFPILDPRLSVEGQWVEPHRDIVIGAGARIAYPAGRLEPLLDMTFLFSPLHAGIDSFMFPRLALGLQYSGNDDMFIGGTLGYVSRGVLTFPFALQVGVDVAWRL